ncbi:hypothetical protein BH24ACT3_BH24ACT3_00600 [soil metagenome]
MAPTIDELVIGDRPDAWRTAGFAVDDDGVCSLGTVEVRLIGDGGRRRVRSWSLHDITVGGGDDTEIDGITTTAANNNRRSTEPVSHPNGTVAIDHVVVATPDGDRTIAALAEVGLEPRRTRPSDTYGAPLVQTFFRMGEVILEVIAPEEPTGDGPARFFGLALTVADLDDTAAHLDEHLGRVKDAVQPGRRIVTLRHTELDLSVPIAFMSPEPAGAAQQ